MADISDLPAEIPVEKQRFLADLVAELRSISGVTAVELALTVAGIESVWQDVVALAGAMYQPRFRLGASDN